MPDVFPLMAVILGLAALGGVLARMFKQPPILGYVMAGLVISFSGAGLKQVQMQGFLEIMSRLGVTLLLFLAGLELPLSELKRMGKVALITGLGQIIITSLVGYLIAGTLGFDRVTSMYIGLAMTFGSTILVVKLLSEKGDLQSLAGKIAIGYLLVQDFVAIGLLVILSGWAKGSLEWTSLSGVAIKGVLMVAVAVWLSENVMGKILDYLAKSTELLFITSIGWCLAVAAIVASPFLGFSVEIGGFLAGLALANVVEQAQIIARVRPLRDFFLTWFFVGLGANIGWSGWQRMVVPGLIMTVYVLICGPIVVMAILGALGYKKRTFFMASLAVAQVSEFSLILVTNAVREGQVRPEILTLVTAVGIVTMTVSTYMIWHANSLYKKLSTLIGVFERKNTKVEEDNWKEMSEHAVLFGHNRVGSRIRPVLEKNGWEVIVVDFNPEIVEKLKSEGVKVIYGDMSDQDLYDKLSLNKAGLIVSTVPDINDNLHLLSSLDREREQLKVITANDTGDAKKLYDSGADYVLVPHNVGGEYLAQILTHHGMGEKSSVRIHNLKNYFGQV